MNEGFVLTLPHKLPDVFHIEQTDSPSRTIRLTSWCNTAKLFSTPQRYRPASALFSSFMVTLKTPYPLLTSMLYLPRQVTADLVPSDWMRMFSTEQTPLQKYMLSGLEPLSLLQPTEQWMETSPPTWLLTSSTGEAFTHTTVEEEGTRLKSWWWVENNQTHTAIYATAWKLVAWHGLSGDAHVTYSSRYIPLYFIFWTLIRLKVFHTTLMISLGTHHQLWTLAS